MLAERNLAVVGLVTAVIIGAGTFFALLMTRGIFDSGHEVTAIFQDAAGIAVDANVLAAGIRVGRVTDVQINGDTAEVSFIFDGDLPADTRARIAVQNLLGRRQLHLIPGSNWNELLRDDDVIPVTQTSTPVDVPEFGETGEQLYREQDQDALQSIVTALADISEDKHAEVGDLIDGLTRVADAVSERREELHDTIDGAQRFFAAFRDRDEEIVRIVDSFGTTLEMIVDRRPEVEELLQNAGDATHLLADLIQQERATLDSLLPTLHRDLQVIDRNLADVAHFFAYAPMSMSGWQQVGYDTDGSDTPHWFNMAVIQAGAGSFDMILGCGGEFDEALDEIFGPDPRSCPEQDAEDPDDFFDGHDTEGALTAGRTGSIAGFFDARGGAGGFLGTMRGVAP
jgi:phospholipid/cholesterol/gamma-HCH transport system substrate-binding protein